MDKKLKYNKIELGARYNVIKDFTEKNERVEKIPQMMDIVIFGLRICIRTLGLRKEFEALAQEFFIKLF